MPGARGLLFGRMEVPQELEDDFNVWYNAEHLPSRFGRVPGFLTARRFRALEGNPKYAAVYDLESPEVLRSPEYLKVQGADRTNPTAEYTRIHGQWRNLERTIYEEITAEPTDYRPPAEARVLLVAMLVPRPEHEDEFNAWYDTEHIPTLLSVPGFLSARRFRAVEGEPKYAAFYDVASYDVLQSPEYLTKRQSPWTTRIGTLLGTFRRNVYERIYPPLT